MAMSNALMAETFLIGDAGRSRPPEELIVAEHLEDTTWDLGDNGLLECRIDGSRKASTIWYKNGRIIRDNSRYRVSSFQNWHRLEIKEIRPTDQGVYCVFCSNGRSQAITSAILFAPIVTLNEVTYFITNPYDCTRIVRHLSPVIINVGDNIELLLKMETYIQIHHYWFKDDVEVFPSDRIHITNNTKMAHLIVKNATPKDAGIYLLVMTTREGALSSYAPVHVLNDIKVEQTNLPAIVEHLKRDLDVLESQCVKMICRGKFDMETTVQWYMNDILIENCHLLQYDYGNGYVALKILDTYPEFSAKYRLVLRDQKTDKVDVSTCNLNIHRNTSTARICDDFVKPLESVVAACGSKVAFVCKFSSNNHKNLRAVWYAGRYRIERSNRLFGVISKGGTFILHIKKMTIGMAGEVMCEIHQWEQSPKCVHVSQTTANLTMVPPGFLGEGIGDILPKMFRRGSHMKPKNTGQPQALPTATAPFRNAENQEPTIQAEYNPHRICTAKPIKFKFCKLDDKGNYYFSMKKTDGIKVFYNPPDRNEQHDVKEISMFQWSHEGATGAWFCVSFQTDDGSFKEFGITEVPKLEVEGPPLESLLIFHITPILPVRTVHRPLVCFRNHTELDMSVPPQRTLRKLVKFDNCYVKRDEVIGGGAFGRVTLVEDEFGESFAAKYIKLNDRIKADFALREFYTLRKLKNNNVVGVVDAYVNTEFIVIVMEYVWGGELFDRIVSDHHINEADIAPVVKQICDGLVYVHSQNIVHLDLKPENIVFAHPNSMLVKLVDFGLSRVIYEGSKTKGVYGTREFVAPEILKFEPITLNSDMWSLGVVVYMMLSGTLPFVGDTEAEQTSKIITAEYNYENPAFRTISEIGKDFIDTLLITNPRCRNKAEEALKHPWIVDGPSGGLTTGALKMARAKLKIYMRIYKAKWQVRNKQFLQGLRAARQMPEASTSNAENI